MEQIKSLAPSTKNNQSNSFTKQKGKTMLKSISKTAQARLVYQGNIRRKSNLESKIVEQKRIIRKKAKLVKRKRGGEVQLVFKQLTPAELTKERSVLEKLKTELIKVKDSLKYSRFNYSKTNRKSANKFKNERQGLAAKKRQKMLSNVSRLITAGKNNGKIEDLKGIVAKLNSEADYSDQDLKREVLPILNSYNKSIPITSLSKDAIAQIKEMLKDINN